MAQDQDRDVKITISAKNLTEAEFGKVKQGLTGIDAAAAKTTKNTSAMGRGFSAFGKAAPGALRAVSIGAVAAAGAVAAVAAAVVKLGERGAAVADVKSQFDQLSVATGETGAIMLGELAAGVKGTISNFELMKVANKALGAGLLSSSEDARTLSEGARLLAKRTGIDTVDAFNMMTTAMASGRTAQLKQIGLFVDNKQAIEDYAAATGKTVAQMNDADRAAALQAATMAALRGQLEMFPAPLADFGELLERGRVGVQNLLDDLSVGVSESPVFLAAMRSAGEAVKEAFGEGPELTAALVSGLERAAFFAIGFARAGISAAQSILQGFSAIKAVVLGVASTFASLNTTILDNVATALEAASNIPILGAGYELAAEKARSLADTTTAISGSLKEQTQDALIAAAGNDALGQGLTRLDEVLVQVNQSMINAGTSERALTAATQEGNFVTDAATLSLFNWNTQLSELPHKMIDLQGNVIATKEEIQVFDEETDLAFLNFAGNINESMVVTKGFGDLTAATTAQTTEAYRFFGMSTQAELEALADAAEESYERMLASGTATEEQLREAAEETRRFREQAQGETESFTLTSNEAIMSGSSQILNTLGGKYKAAAIAQALIATYIAVAKSLAAAPWPANLILAAGALAAGLINVNKIRSSPAYQEGTPGLDFANFGRESPARLHGLEAVIPQGGGHMLGREVASELARLQGPAGSTEEMIGEVRAMTGELRDLPNSIQRAVRDGVMLASASSVG